MALHDILDIINFVGFVVRHPILTILIALGFLMFLGSVGIF